MRIIAGQHRGLTLASVGKGDAAAHLRPTPDRVRESLFNVLMGHGLPQGARVLDLFAGTGALGLEALSRGATHCTFVDNGRTAQKLIRENIAKTRREDDATLLTCAADKLPAAPAPCDLVFLDPPYGKGLAANAVTSAKAGGWLASDALIVVEDNAPQPLAGFVQVDLRRYGDTYITLMAAP
ncbi:16S rRNA (guanine(966)-N(2))-methyltransferase RsmD [Pseudooctadecabacter sp.]|uniref:16S rRNA (guanine(966)-N(2))-methyltransferase RsmD n=1 Tax=Pseudooctadecabacter sp. TaxID=1966338 RepID=UPI0025EFFE9C|nr:16S rRNA (guanine(966)-N(2))-methyltransferase RsmD [Pseudooctadecabacter sp.]